jgi:glycosyltransferase involved in cell wall biosynthesis
MAKKKLAIVSSYDELCGNASYTKALADGLSKYYDVTVISLNVALLRSCEKDTAEVHIREVCQQLKTFDCVNVQFEAGLFGSTLPQMFSRFLAIARASKRFVLTMHRFHAKEKYPTILLMAKSMLSGRIGRLIAEFQYAYANNRYLPLYHKVIAFCKKNNAPILVHTKRDAALIKKRCKYDNVYDHPLCFYTQQYLEAVEKECSKQDFCKQYLLDENKRYIGIFGFINGYKSHETIIKALKYLPNQYELLIFGSQHPHTIKLEEKINPYIDDLIKLITKERLDKRVKFYGSLNDDDFLKALLSCDFNVLPYLEVNQGGSAIAALSLETGAKSIFSQNRAFLELAKYAPNSFKMVTVGNYLELAQAILSYRESEYKNNLKEYCSKYNINTSAHLYHQLLSELSEKVFSEVKISQENCHFEHEPST